MRQAAHTRNSNQATKMPAIVTAEDGFLGHQRMRELELRVNQAEQSNRALLEELVRLQNEYKSFTRRTDQLLEEEKLATKQVEQSNQMLQKKLMELEERSKRAEQEVVETKNALAQLVNHTRGVERAVTTSQQDLINKKEQSLLRVTELNRLCTELKSQVENQSRTHTFAEQALSNRLSDLTNLLAEQDRKRDEMIRIVETHHRDFTSHNDSSQYQIQSKIDQTLGAVTHDVTARETKLKQELHEKLYTLERQIAIDRENKLHDRSLRDELEQRIHSSKKRLEDDVTAVKNKLETQTKEVDKKIRELYKATNLLDQEIQHVREHSEHILGSEIKIRKSSEKEVFRRIEEYETRLKSTIDAITSLKTDPNGKVSEIKIADLKIHQFNQENVDKIKQDIGNDLKDLDEKISQVETKLIEYEDNESQQLHKINPEIESLAFTQERLENEIKEMQNDIRQLPRNSTNKYETKNNQNQIDKTQTSIRKLAESVQVVKNVLLDRIKEEENNRQRQTNILKTELLKLRSKLDELVND